MDIKVSFGPHGIKARRIVEQNLIEILKGIAHGRWQKEVEEVRTLLSRDGEKAAGAMKEKLPWFTPSGIFQPSRKAADLRQHSGVYVIDFDGLNPAGIPGLKDRLMQTGSVLTAFVSPSGQGLKVLIPGLRATDEGGHRQEYGDLKTWAENQIQEEADKSGSDLCRACFVSFDPDLRHNLGAVRPPIGNPECYTETQTRRYPETQTPRNPVIQDVPTTPPLNSPQEDRVSRIADEVYLLIQQHKLVPTEIHATNVALFGLCRLGRTLEHKLGGTLKHHEQEALFRFWHQAATESGREVLSRPFEEYLLEFFGQYPKAKTPIDQHSLEAALDRAKQAPMPPLPLEAAHFTAHPRISLLIKLCWQLARYDSDGIFYLSCRDVARRLGVDPMTALRWLNGLASVRLIERVETGGLRSVKGKPTKRVATVYRWLGSESPQCLV